MVVNGERDGGGHGSGDFVAVPLGAMNREAVLVEKKIVAVDNVRGANDEAAFESANVPYANGPISRTGYDFRPEPC